MPKKVHEIAEALMRSGKSKGSAWAIAQKMKRGKKVAADALKRHNLRSK